MVPLTLRRRRDLPDSPALTALAAPASSREFGVRIPRFLHPRARLDSSHPGTLGFPSGLMRETEAADRMTSTSRALSQNSMTFVLRSRFCPYREGHNRSGIGSTVKTLVGSSSGVSLLSGRRKISFTCSRRFFDGFSLAFTRCGGEIGASDLLPEWAGCDFRSHRKCDLTLARPRSVFDGIGGRLPPHDFCCDDPRDRICAGSVRVSRSRQRRRQRT